MATIANAPGGQDSSVGGSEKIPVDDAGTGKYLTVDQIKAYVIDAVEAIAAGTAVDGSDKIYILDATDSVLKPVDIDTVLQHIVDAIWAKTALTDPASADAILIKDGGVGGTEKTVTLELLAEYVRATIEAAILDISGLSSGAGSLASADYMLVTQSGVGKRIAVSDLNTFIYTGFKTYIDTLSAVGTPTDTDYFYCVQGTTQKTVTLAKLSAFIESKLPTTTTPNYIPQWDNATGTLKDGKELVTTISGSSTDDQIPTANSVKDFTDVLVYSQTDIGADLADADTIIVDDGALGTTQRKSALSRVWTYIWSKFTGASEKTTPVSADIIPIQDSADSNNIKEMTITNMMKALDIDGMTDIGAALADVDLIIVDDGAGGTNRKSAISRLWTYFLSKAQSAVDLIFGDMTPGTGISAGTGTTCEHSVIRVGGLYKTTILVDLTGLNSGGADHDIIGVNATANPCHIGQITAALNGTIFAGKMTCLEVPVGGSDDIDLYSSTVATGSEDADVTALAGAAALVEAGGAWTLMASKPLTAFPAANVYLYLAGNLLDAAYTAGIFEIELWGK